MRRLARYLKTGVTTPEGRLAAFTALGSISLALAQILVAAFVLWYGVPDVTMQFTSDNLVSAGVWTINAGMFLTSVLVIGWYYDRPPILDEYGVA